MAAGNLANASDKSTREAYSAAYGRTTASPTSAAVENSFTGHGMLKPEGGQIATAGIPQFGDIPPTEQLRLPGHAKINSQIRWVSKQADGLYLQSQYGILRLSPIGSAIMRVTFAKGSKLMEYIHPYIAVNRVEKNWRYRDTGRLIELSTGEMLLRVDKQTVSIQYMDTNGRLFLAERKNESRVQEVSGGRLYFELQKGEQLYALRPGEDIRLKLRGSARYLSVAQEKDTMPPLIFSDKCYGILPATGGSSVFCDVPAYGSYLYLESAQFDFYFIAGKQRHTIEDAYRYLCGLL